MKKILLTMAFVLTALGNAWADDVTVDNITIPQGSVATLEISLTNAANQFLQLFQIVLHLPEGITAILNTAELNRDRFNHIALWNQAILLRANIGSYAQQELTRLLLIRLRVLL